MHFLRMCIDNKINIMSNERIILEGCISQYKEDNELTSIRDSDVFELFSLNEITKRYQLLFENIQNSVVDGGHDGGIDSIMLLVNDEIVDHIDDLEEFKFNSKTVTKIIITQCKKENSFKEGPLDKLITSIPELFNLASTETSLLTRFNSNVVDRAIIVREVWTKTAVKGGNIELEYVYTCNADAVFVSGSFSSKKDQLIALTKSTFSTEAVSLSTYSAKELLASFRTTLLDRITLEFKEQPLSTSFAEYGIGYVGMVKLGKYKSFLTSSSGEIRDDLFESNIRHFQGAVDVNKKISASIQHTLNRDFWWLNNGITIIAESPNQIGSNLSLENIQIVNGLQTSYSIFNSHDGDLIDERSVMVKVIITDDKETIDNIIASTNSQNPVSATLLRATDTIQRNIELYFFNKGYFYDRRKNYYKNQGKPSSRIFSIQFTAQSIRSIADNDPHSARAKPTSLLKDDRNYNQIFNSDRDFQGYFNCCLLQKSSNDLWLAIEDAEEKRKTANFKLHMAWLLPRLILETNSLSFDQICGFDFENLTQEKYNDAKDFLIENIDEYLEENENSNLINIAKSSGFTTYLTDKVIAKFN